MTRQTSNEPWQTCYEELAPKLLLFARQWVECAADAEDVVQTAFVKFWRRQPAANAEHFPLLYAAVRSTALDLRRTASRRGRREQVVAQSPETAYFDATIEQQEDAEAVEQAIRRLPEEQREVLVLRIWGELTFAEIATAVGGSINTVASRYRYALEALRRSFKPDAYERIRL